VEKSHEKQYSWLFSTMFPISEIQVFNRYQLSHTGPVQPQNNNRKMMIKNRMVASSNPPKNPLFSDITITS